VPSVVLDYNEFKCGVDTVDQLRESYSMGRKSKKWWPCLVWWCLDICIINAYSLHCMNTKDSLTHLQFRERLMNQLREKYGQPRSPIGRKRHKTTSTNQNQHWPILVEEQGRCWYCHNIKKNRSAPQTKCESCNIYLCIDDCFKKYHTITHSV
jgi:Transposase IS4